MSGITIIEEHLCRVVEFPTLIGTGISITLLCGGSLLMYSLMRKYSIYKEDKTTAIVCSILIVIMYVVFLVVSINNYNNTHMEYTIAIDDSVSFNDFHAKYEIVSENGNRYRVVEK